MPTKWSLRPDHGCVHACQPRSLADESRIERVAQEAFGYPELRPGQREAIEAALDGRDVLVVMSTGAGKSAIYQIAGLLTPGSTVVVSPLIALQRDQVDGLREVAAGGAAQLNSSLPRGEREEALHELAEDALEFLFLAPEQLAQARRARRARGGRHLAVRRRRGALRLASGATTSGPSTCASARRSRRSGARPCSRLTATAAPPVRDEIVARLGLRDPEVLIRGFDRPNLRFSVERFHGEQGAERKRRALRERIAALAPPGIVYVSTRREAEELADELCSGPLRAASYHAGMKPPERDDVQERFMDGELDVVVATTAFGMGIDKADVRWVFHAEVAESLDAYYQEVGPRGPRRRARRDRPVLPHRGRRPAALLRRRARRGRRDRARARRRAPGRAGAELRAEVDLSDDQARVRAVAPGGRGRGARGHGRRGRAGHGRAVGGGGARRRRGRGDAALVRPLARGHDARLRRDRRLPARVHPVVLRRAVRAAVRVLRQLRGGARERPAGGRAVPGRRPGRARHVGRGRRPALRRRRDGRPVRRGGLQDARAAKSCASARCSPPCRPPPRAPRLSPSLRSGPRSSCFWAASSCSRASSGMLASSTASIDSLARSVASSWISLAACSASFVPARTSSAVFCASSRTWVAWSWILLASSWSTPPAAAGHDGQRNSDERSGEELANHRRSSFHRGARTLSFGGPCPPRSWHPRHTPVQRCGDLRCRRLVGDSLRDARRAAGRRADLVGRSSRTRAVAAASAPQPGHSDARSGV